MSVIDKTNEYFIYSTYRSNKKTTEISLYPSDTHTHMHTYIHTCINVRIPERQTNKIELDTAKKKN